MFAAKIAKPQTKTVPFFPSHRAGQAYSRPPLAAAQLPDALQPKLAVGQVHDPLEDEADRVAGQVMRMPDPSLSIADAQARLSRKCAACEEEDKARMLQTHSARVAHTATGAAPPIVHEVLRSPGQPLDPASRAYFEPRFGHSFSQVRIHMDRRATESARAVGALAYTVGRDVVVAEGSYSPDSVSGRRLLAHELTHVIQQGNAHPTRNSDRADGSGARVPISTMQPSGERRVQRQGLDPNQLFCAAMCAICFGTLVAPELIVPELACAFCWNMCATGGMSAADQGAPGQDAPGQGAPGPSAVAYFDEASTTSFATV